MGVLLLSSLTTLFIGSAFSLPTPICYARRTSLSTLKLYSFFSEYSCFPSLGVRTLGSQASASFTSDGKHVISITEDSNVYIWNYTNQDQNSSKAKSMRSHESFLSQNASVAIPWGGLKTKTRTLNGSILENGHFEKDLLPKMPSSFPDCFALGRGFFLDSLYKGSATWPEEKLQEPNSPAVSPSICKSEFKFLKSALQSALNSPNLWGLVIVTAGLDGCIKTFLNYGLPIRF